MEPAMQVAAVCVGTAIVALTLRRGSPETALLLTLAAAVVIFLFLAEDLRTLLSFLRRMAARSGVSADLYGPLYKTLGIALVVRLGGDLCRDAGESALATALETAGSVCALVVALPLLHTVLDLLSGWMQ